MARTDGRQGGGVATAAGAKAEVLPHGHKPGFQLLHQHLLHEGLRAEGGQLGGEGHQHQLLNAEGLQQMQFFARQIETQAGIAEQHLAGMGPEAHHRGHQACGGGRAGDGGNHPAVTLVQAIEAAQGNRRGALGLFGAAQSNRGAQGHHRRELSENLPWPSPLASSHGRFGRRSAPPPPPAPWPTASTCS